jgi:hypothetical protein
VRYLLGQLGIRPTNPGLEDTLSLRISIDTRHYLDRFLILVGLFVPELNMSLDRPEEEYPHDDLVPLPDALASEIFTKWGDLIPTFKPHLDAFREIFPGSLVPRSFADELYAATYDPQGVEGKENTYTLSFNSGFIPLRANHIRRAGRHRSHLRPVCTRSAQLRRQRLCLPQYDRPRDGL